jgi:DNA-binding CsgD family transcriptional regulator
MGNTRIDPLGIVEAAYRLEGSDEEWLQGLAQVARPDLDEGFGLAAFEYYRPGGEPTRIVQRCYLGIPEPLAEIYPRVFQTMDPEIRELPFRIGPCVSGSQMMGMRREFREQPHMKRYAQQFGVYDSIWITAAEPSGRGCGFHAGRAKIGWASPARVERWGRIAAHLATALRLRYRLKASAPGPPPPEAVFDPGGRVQDARGHAATDVALATLRRAVVDLEKLRGPLRLENPDRSLSTWKALVEGRWSLIDQVERDGRRYIVARENEPAAAGPEKLTARERQIIACAKLGHHNKLIAYELGIADSTVRVLLARAAAKLGARNRNELLQAVP